MEAEIVNNKPRAQTERLKPAMIVGNGPVAHLICAMMRSMNIDVNLVYCQEPSAYIHSTLATNPSSKLAAVIQSGHGFFRGFELSEIETMKRLDSDFTLILKNGERINNGCVILAPDLRPKNADLSLPADVEPVPSGKLCNPGGKVVFLLDYKKTSDPGPAMAAIVRAMENIEAGGESSVIMRHVPVRHIYGETQYDEAKSKGVRFFRHSETYPEVKSSPTNGGFVVRVVDGISGPDPIEIKCDRVIVATEPDPDDIIEKWRHIADGDEDSAGYLLDESIHCHSGRSFTNGVFAVGAITGTGDLNFATAQAASAAVKARGWLLGLASGKTNEKITIDDSCCRCLTCRRICPHRAIFFNPGVARSKIISEPVFCEECGLCVSECPQNAIEFIHLQQDQPELKTETTTRAQRQVLVLGCERSAGRAIKEIEPLEGVMFRPVECAGAVSESMLLDSLASGVAGILVLGCHKGNCKSKNGTDWAGARVQTLLEALGPGANPAIPKLEYKTVASNESARLYDVIRQFKKNCE